MERNNQKVGLINLLVLLLAALVGFFLSRYSNSLAGQVTSVFFGLGFLVAAVSYFQMRLEESERLERLEFDELTRSKNAASLFDAEAGENFPARRSREQFERFFVAGFTFVLFVLQGAAAVFLWRWLKPGGFPPVENAIVALALFAVLFLVLFLLGRYSVSLARFQKERLLRPSASYLVLGAYLSAILTGSLGAVWGGFPQTDIYVARGLSVLLALVAIENLITLVLELYRPRMQGRTERVIYESRLVGLLGQPEGIVTTAAQALDYQFGFKVSDTWFYRFLEKALAWLILAQFAILLFSTSFVFIEPGEQGLIERFGRPLTSVNPLSPGPHLKMPWPVDRVFRYRTQEIQTFEIGMIRGEEEHEEKIVLWTRPHTKEEFNLLVASRNLNIGALTNQAEQGVPVDFLTVGIPVQYQIQDIQAWAYNYVDAGMLLERIATREVIRYLVSVDIFQLMSTGRSKAAQDLRQLLQKEADDLKLGVKIVFVGLQDIHPPVKVAGSFESVIGAGQENQAKLRNAEGYAARTVPMAHAEAERMKREAEAYRIQKITGALAQSAQFTNQIVAYNASPEVFLQRSYLQTLARGSSTNTPKFFLGATNTDDVLILNLEEKVRRDILDLQVPKK
ncbi:MAG: hypothetical protein JWM99_3955 [Verrucomicrobiales bacterium]|nr:hypothetical protein [Verrucomicrobiales bacterium]